MYTIIRERQSTDLPIAGQRPQKGDRHAGNIRQDQSAGRERLPLFPAGCGGTDPLPGCI